MPNPSNAVTTIDISASQRDPQAGSFERQLVLASGILVPMPAGFDQICEGLRARSPDMATTESALVNRVVGDLDRANAESIKAFLDRILDGTVTDAELSGIWEFAETGMTFECAKDLRWFMGLLRVGIADMLS